MSLKECDTKANAWQIRATGGLNIKLTYICLFCSIALPLIIANPPLIIQTIPPLEMCARCCLIHLGCVLFCILRVALFRTTSEQDIDGSGLTQPSAEMRILSALLQNTFEQTFIAISTYGCWAILMPADWQGAIPLSTCFFLLGRILFYVGYKNGSRGRAIGFALTMIPTLNMFMVLIGKLVYGH